MDKLKQLITEANTEFKIADHLAYVTYSTIRESKLLYAIAEVLYNSLSQGELRQCLHMKDYTREYPLVPGTFGKQK